MQNTLPRTLSFTIATLLLWWLPVPMEAGISARVAGAFYSFPSNSFLNPGNFLDLKSNGTLSSGLIAEGEKENPVCGSSLLRFSNYLELDLLDTQRVRNRVNELYLTFPLAQTTFIDLGKIADRNGVAFFQNPTDFLILQKPDMTIESKESAERFYEGLIMVRFQALLPLLTLETGYAPQIIWNEQRLPFSHYLFSMQNAPLLYCKAGGTLKGIDAKGILAFDSTFKAGFNSSAAIGDRFELHFECALKDNYNRYNLQKVQFMAPNLNMFSYDSAYSTREHWAFSAVTGGHCSFSNRSNLMLEYCYNGEGLSSEQLRALRVSASSTRKNFDSVALRSISLRSIQSYGELIERSGIPGLSRHYFILRYFVPLRPYVSIEGINAQSISDFSGSIILRSVLAVNKIDLSLSAAIPYGQANREFGFSLSTWTLGFIGEVTF